MGNRKFIALIMGASFVIYLGLIFAFHHAPQYKELAFNTNDAKDYKIVSDWIFGKSDFTPYEHISTRPFFFPLLIGAFTSIFGVAGIWILNLILWLGALYILIGTIQLITPHKKWIILGAAIFAINITKAIVTLHALTETLVAFLLSIFTYFLISKLKNNTKNTWGGLILTASLLTVTKPLFKFLLIFTLIALVIEWLLNKKRPSLRHLGIIVVVMLPLFIQLGMTKKTIGTASISNIGGYTFRNYYFGALYSNVTGVGGWWDDEVKNMINPMDNEEIWQFMADHPGAAVKTFFELMISENIAANSTIAGIPDYHMILSKISLNMNRLYFGLHVVLLIIILYLIYQLFFKYKAYHQLVYLLLLACPLYLILVSSGITFWQGDRVILPAISVWICLYIYTIDKLKKLSAKEVVPKDTV